MTRDQIVAEAKKHIGTPYKKLDCSKLVQKVLGSLGYKIPRNSEQQAKFFYEKGMTINIEKSMPVADIVKLLKKADFVIWGNPKYTWRWLGIHHIAIYDEDGYEIESTGSGNGVHRGKVWESKGESGWQIIMIVRVDSIVEGGEEEVINKNSNTAEIKEIQRTLIVLGFKSDMDEVNLGEWGSRTEKALNAFQTSVNLPIGNEVNPATAAAMFKALREKAALAEANYAGYQCRVSTYIGGVKTAANMKI